MLRSRLMAARLSRRLVLGAFAILPFVIAACSNGASPKY